MLYAFIALSIIILIALLCFSFFKAKKSSLNFKQNQILLKKYNKLLKKISKQNKFNHLEYLLKIRNKKILSEKDILNNIEIINNINKNYCTLQNSNFTKLIKLDALLKQEDECYLQQKKCELKEVLDTLKANVLTKQLDSEISAFFGNMEGYCIDGYLIFFLNSKLILIEESNVFNINVLDYKGINFSIEKLESHEVEYDGILPLEELDFRLEEILNDTDKGYETITKVKCSKYILKVVTKNKVLKSVIHLMRKKDIEKIEKFIKQAV